MAKTPITLYRVARSQLTSPHREGDDRETKVHWHVTIKKLAFHFKGALILGPHFLVFDKKWGFGKAQTQRQNPRMLSLWKVNLPPKFDICAKAQLCGLIEGPARGCELSMNAQTDARQVKIVLTQALLDLCLRSAIVRCNTDF